MRLVTLVGEGRHSFRFDGITGRHRVELAVRGRSQQRYRDTVAVVGASEHRGTRLRGAIIVRDRQGDPRRTRGYYERKKTGNTFIRMFNSAYVPRWIPVAIHRVDGIPRLTFDAVDGPGGSGLSINLNETCGNLYTPTREGCRRAFGCSDIYALADRFSRTCGRE